MENNKNKIIVIIILLVVLAGMGLIIKVVKTPDAPGKYDAFATCLKDKGATFYGAFWCPHCQKQKAMFGTSVHLLPYVECSTPDGQGQTQICKDKKVSSYPTWELADGTRLPVESEAGVSLQTLANKTSCTLPQ